jgi:hypothetical protein
MNCASRRFGRGSNKGACRSIPKRGKGSRIESETNETKNMAPDIGQKCCSSRLRVYQQQNEEIPMKSHNIKRNQFGFFDLGLSLLVLTLAGGSVYLIESSRPEASTAQPPAVEVATDHHGETTLAQR